MRALAVLLLLPACTTQPAELAIAAQLPTPLDVLVVVDDTSVAQTGRIPDPANLAGVLEGIYNGAPDLRIAVTTTTTGTLRTSPIVPGGVIEHAVRMEDGLVDKNYSGELVTAVGSLLGFDATTGSNTALASTVLALDNGALVRDDAALGILLVSATDDASADAPGVYAAAIQAHATRTMVSVVDQQPAERIGEFLGAMTLRYETPIDAYNMEAISAFAGMFDPIANDSCFPLAIASAGDCELASAYQMVSNPLPACTGDPSAASSPCFMFVSDASCPSGWSILYGGAYRYYHPAIFGRCSL